jgi:hypothetical protein
VLENKALTKKKHMNYVPCTLPFIPLVTSILTVKTELSSLAHYVRKIIH